MADLRIVDAPLLSTVKGTEKIPTGGEGNFSVSVNQVADFAKLKWVLATEGYVDNAVGNVQADLNLHKNNSSNPHQVTKSQVGLGNVDNTADLDKPLSNADIAALSLKADKLTTYTKSETDILLSPITQEIQSLENAGGLKQYDRRYYFDSNYASTVGGYPINAEIMLSNGDIVKSTVANNTIDPNADMTGWVNLSEHNILKNRDTAGAHPSSAILDASGNSQQEVNDYVLYSIPSASDLRLTNPIKKGQKVILESHILNNGKGGNVFIATQKVGLSDNNGTVFSSPDPLLFWVRLDQSQPCAEWFGAVGDGIADDSSAVQAAVTYGQTNKKTLVCDNAYKIMTSITSGAFAGITSNSRAKFIIGADIIPFKLTGVEIGKQFEKVEFTYSVATATNNPTIQVDTPFHVMGFKVRNILFNGTTNQGWIGLQIIGSAGKGFFGGWEFSNIESFHMYADLHFSAGNYFVNSGTVANNFNWYGNYGVLADVGCNVNNLVFQNYQQQQGVNTTIQANGTFTKCILDLIYNWDGGKPAIYLSENCFNNSIRNTYNHSIQDFGFQTIIDKREYVLTDTVIAQQLIERNGEFTESSLSNVMKIAKTGAVQTAEGISSDFGGNNLRQGLAVYAEVGQALTMYNKITQITGATARPTGEFGVFGGVRFNVEFEILSTVLDDDAIYFGIGYSSTDAIPATPQLGVTIKSGRVVVMEGATQVYDLGAVSKKLYNVQIYVKVRDSSQPQAVHVNSKVVYRSTSNPANAYKRTFLNVKGTTNPTYVNIIALSTRTFVGSAFSTV